MKQTVSTEEMTRMTAFIRKAKRVRFQKKCDGKASEFVGMEKLISFSFFLQKITVDQS